MAEIHEFISSLFEKSKVLNDLNTQFLEDLQIGELSSAQKLSLLQKSTSYHENILFTIQKIVAELDKTSVLISPEQAQVLKLFLELSDTNKVKALEILEALQEAVFVPKELMVCPLCGHSLISGTDNNGGCKKFPVILGKKIIGYTVKCINQKETSNESK